MNHFKEKKGLTMISFAVGDDEDYLELDNRSAFFGLAMTHVELSSLQHESFLAADNYASDARITRGIVTIK